MLIKPRPDIVASEITDEQLYLRRREFLRRAGTAVLGAAAGSLASGCSGDAVAAQTPLANVKPKVVATDERLNTFEEITSYNNFYEFGTGKDDPQQYAGRMKTSPWKVKMDGHCAKPADYLIEDLIRPLRGEAGKLVARKCGKRTIILQSDLITLLNSLPTSVAPSDSSDGHKWPESVEDGHGQA